jgi:hypothetical protein
LGAKRAVNRRFPRRRLAVARDEPRGFRLITATSLGGQFGLGTCTRALKARRSSWWLAGTFTGIGAFGATGALVSPYAAAGAALLFAAALAAARRWVWPPKVDWVFWYPGGLAQLTAREAAPRIVAWDRAASVTATVESSGESGLTTVTACRVRGQDGAEVVVDAGYGPSTPRDFLREAARVLAPRLVPPLIRAYDSGEPVIFGATRIDLAGITSARGSGGQTVFTPWHDMRHIDGRLGDLVPAVAIRTAARRARSVTLSGEPNGIFVFDVARHAAARNGVEFRDVIPAAAPGNAAGWSARRPDARRARRRAV